MKAVMIIFLSIGGCVNGEIIKVETLMIDTYDNCIKQAEKFEQVDRLAVMCVKVED